MMRAGVVGKTLFAAFGMIAAAGAAIAADLPTKAPPPPVSTSYDWTGFYVGGNVGYSWGDPRTDIAGNATTVSRPGGCPICFTNPPATFADSLTQRLDAFSGGGQLGYNYQPTPNWVLGFEADIQGAVGRAANTAVDTISGTFCTAIFGFPPFGCAATAPLTGTAATSYEAKIEWFGTVRGRLGVLINDRLLLYGTGGLAYGRVGISGSVSVNATADINTFGPNTSTFGQSKINIGFATGAGLEGQLSAWLPPNWMWKLEYLYIDLGSLDTSTSFAAGTSSPFATALSGTMATHTHFTDNIVRVGLNYQLR